MSELLKKATDELGTEERPGAPNNERIVSYAKESGIEWIEDDEEAWCSTFMNWCAKEAGLEASGKATARSWTEVGEPVDTPSPGDVVVYWREDPDSWKGHVGVFLGFDPEMKNIFTLGGNQSDRVSIEPYPRKRVLSFRRLEGAEGFGLPKGILEKGDKGEKVRSLQKGLEKAGLDPGPIDGDYGPKTESTVKDFQQKKEALKVDGVYGPNTRDALKEAVQ